MNCDNCGAPLQVVTGRDYLACEFCGSFFFPNESRDGVKMLGGESQVDCPVCETPLVTASVAEVAALSCPRCLGLLCRMSDFSFIVQYLRQSVEGPEYRPRPLDRSELARSARCPQCGQKMSTHAYYGPGNVVVDNCANCGLIWLDAGELYRITHADGPDRPQAKR